MSFSVIESVACYIMLKDEISKIMYMSYYLD